MKIVCAASVLFGREAFGTLGETIVLPDDRITRDDLRNADALVIRSKTSVTADLLQDTPVAFVGTATAGFDHLDTAAIEAAGAAWYAAPGCNANSVAEYVVTALLRLAGLRGLDFAGRALGVVGVGEVGRRVAEKAAILGLRVLKNDPPLALAGGAGEFLDLDRVLEESDAVTLHVPLTRGGPFPTERLAGCHFFEHLKPGACFLNTSRGEVADEEALLLALDRGMLSCVALDVWDHEPEISPALLERATIGTPHIAGYSWDGRLNGTVAVYRQACRFFELSPSWKPPELDAPPGGRHVVDARGRTDQEVLAELTAAAYDLEGDARALKEKTAESLTDRFRRLRRTYPPRREFNAHNVELLHARPELEEKIAVLGFRLV